MSHRSAFGEDTFGRYAEGAAVDAEPTERVEALTREIHAAVQGR